MADKLLDTLLTIEKSSFGGGLQAQTFRCHFQNIALVGVGVDGNGRYDLPVDFTTSGIADKVASLLEVDVLWRRYDAGILGNALANDAEH